jgi:hypothetical protein
MPMLLGHITYMDLKSGALDLEDIALIHDALEVKRENERRYHGARERQ